VAAGRVPIILGTGHYSTRLTIELSTEACKCGADAVIVILPYYQRPPKPAVIRHFREVRAAVDVPVMLYNNPANSACVDFTPREVAQLVEEDVIHMVKSTYETVVPIHDLAYLAGSRMAIFYGSFLAAYEALTAGAHGWISGILNIVPQTARELYDAVVIGNDAQRGFAIWKRILPLVHLYAHGRIGPVSDLAIYRSILNFWGLEGGYCRSPYYPLNSDEERRLVELLKEAGWMEPAQSCG
jgi:4-hydroxy-tetrahydrodipicolinate synthase